MAALPHPTSVVALIEQQLESGQEIALLSIALTDGASLAWLYRHGRVVSREDDEEFAHLQVRLHPKDLARFEHRQQAEGGVPA